MTRGLALVLIKESRQAVWNALLIVSDEESGGAAPNIYSLGP